MVVMHMSHAAIDACLHCLVTVQATTAADMVRGVEAAARALCEAEQSARDSAAAAFAMAVSALVSVAEASAGAVAEGVEHAARTCRRLSQDTIRVFSGGASIGGEEVKQPRDMQ